MKTITTLDALVAAAGKRQSVTNWKPNTEDNPKPAAWVLNWQGYRLALALKAGLKIYTPKSGKWERGAYRMLRNGETIKEGDEFQSQSIGWTETVNPGAVMRTELVGKYRRPIRKGSK